MGNGRMRKRKYPVADGEHKKAHALAWANHLKEVRGCVFKRSTGFQRVIKILTFSMSPGCKSFPEGWMFDGVFMDRIVGFLKGPGVLAFTSLDSGTVKNRAQFS